MSSDSETWHRSPERTAAFRVTILCTIAVIVPSIVIGALLAKKQQDTGQAVELADSVTDRAASDLSSASQAESTLLFDISTGATNLPAESSQQQLAAASARTQQAREDLAAARQAEFVLEREKAGMLGTWLLYAGAVIAAIVSATLLLMYFRSEKRREYENRRILTQLEESSPEAGADIDDVMGFETLWQANKDQLQHYHRLVLNYATSTRQTTQFALLAGFSFLILVGLFALVAHTVPSAVASSVVATAGAVVTGFIAHAVLKNADTSSREMLAFFSHPLEVERVLTAERVIRSMPAAAQEVAKLRIVEGLTRTGTPSGAGGDVVPDPGNSGTVPKR
jgi:hypothetical protein